MDRKTSKKKIIMAAILSSGLALAISQSALAEPAAQPEGQSNTQIKNSSPHYKHQMDPDMQKAREKFLGDTVVLRKQLVEKNAAMSALSSAGTPDTTKVSQLAGEIFDLREKLRVKAQEAGLPMMGMGMGDADSMPCQGMGGNRHMM